MTDERRYAGYDKDKCQQDLRDYADKGDEESKTLIATISKCFIKKPQPIFMKLIYGLCLIIFTITAGSIGLIVQHVSASEERMDRIEKTQSQMAEGFKNVTEIMKKQVELTDKLNDASIRSEERGAAIDQKVDAEIERSKREDTEQNDKLDKIWQKVK